MPLMNRNGTRLLPDPTRQFRNAPSDSFKDFVVDQLRAVDDLTCRAMFGGHGLYSRNYFFGIVYQGRLYFKTNDRTRPAYDRLGMRPFQPNPELTLKNYYEVPPGVVEDRNELTQWALDTQVRQFNLSPSKQTARRKARHGD